MVGGTVVVADDSHAVRSLMRELLEVDAGYEVVAEAADGEAAVRAIAFHRPDLAVIDVRMPRLDGISVVQQIQRVSPRTRVFLLSGDSDPKLERQAMEAGAQGLLIKGGPIDDMLDRLSA